MDKRLNSPIGYTNYVKSWPKFSNGVLDNFPRYGIIYYENSIPTQLGKIGIGSQDFTTLQIGTSMPGRVYLIEKTQRHPRFFIAEGLPGGGGISTLAAEFYALGAESIIHVGLCGLLGDAITTGAVILSSGSRKDSAARYLSEPADQTEISYPSQILNAQLRKQLKSRSVRFEERYGYTIPIFYFPAESLLHDIITGRISPNGKKATYLEMEQASFFQTAARMGRAAASMVVGSDRYTLKDGKVSHEFETDFDQDDLELSVLNICLSVFNDLHNV